MKMQETVRVEFKSTWEEWVAGLLNKREEHLQNTAHLPRHIGSISGKPIPTVNWGTSWGPADKGWMQG